MSAEVCRLTREDVEQSVRAVEEAEKKMKVAAAKPPPPQQQQRGNFSFNVPTFPGSMQESDSIKPINLGETFRVFTCL